MGKTNAGKKMILNRSYKSTPDYTTVSRFKVGQGTTAFSTTDTDLVQPVPITNGTVIDNGSNLITGSGGGTNTTDNTSTYKEGAGESDATSQNMLANVASATKTWTLTPLTANFSATEPFGFWLYIKDATAYAKFLTAGTALQLRIRTNGDLPTQYYYYNRTKAQLAVGWNWITSGTTTVNGLGTGAGGAPSGAMNEFIIEITTNNATDTFIAGDVLYDLMRRWATTDLYTSVTATYPLLNETNLEVEVRGFVNSVQANGFLLTETGDFNSDTSMLIDDRNTFTSISKSSTDQLILIWKDRIL